MLALNNLKKTIAALIMFGVLVQMLPFSILAQSYKSDKSEQVAKAKQNDQPDSALPGKIAPELEDNLNNLASGLRADETRKIIIQLKSATRLNEVLSDAASPSQKIQMDLDDVRSNKERAKLIKSRLPELQGHLKKSFNNLGLVSAELPLSKIRELVEDENIAYISPDSDLMPTGHLETTTGANLVRNLISPTTPLDGRGIGVAVLDSGIDGSHVLTGAAPGENRPGVIFNKDFSMTCTWCWDTGIDVYGHGSHVATMLAGRASITSYAGVAPNVNLLNLKVLDGQGKGSASNLIAAIDWAIANRTAYNIRVMNISLGTPASDSYLNDPMCLAVRRAVNAGIVVVASAGNNGRDQYGNKLFGTINSPGIEPSAITVGAANTYGTDYRSDDGIATFSSKGPTRGYRTVNNVRRYDNLIKPDLVAPGNKLIGVLTTYRNTAGVRAVGNLPAGFPGLETNPLYQNDPYSRTMYLSGTSMAAPVVAGAAALLLQANPGLTPNLVKAILMYSAQPLNGYSTLEQGAGLLNVDGAVRLAKLVKTTLPTTNGAAMLKSALPASQTSSIGGQTVFWGKGIITNFGFISGNDLMNKYQGMYGNGVLMSDATPFSGNTISRSTALTNGTLSLYQGAIRNNGVLMGDGTNYLSSNALGGSPPPVINSQGILVSDGVLISDGVIMGDGVLMSDNVAAYILGDNTSCMLPAP